MHYTNLLQIFAPIYSLEESLLVTKSQRQSADFGQSELIDFTKKNLLCLMGTGFNFLVSNYYFIHLENQTF